MLDAELSPTHRDWLCAALRAGQSFDPAALAAGLGLARADAADVVRGMRAAALVQDAGPAGHLELTGEGRDLAGVLAGDRPSP